MQVISRRICCSLEPVCWRSLGGAGRGYAKDSEAIYKGGHHVLHDLAKVKKLAPLLKPVLEAFDQAEPEVSVPVAAQEALRTSFAS